MPLSRRRFLQAAAFAAPMTRHALRATPSPPPASPAPDLPIDEFPLLNVAPADAHAVRKSEPSLVELKDGNVLLAYARYAGRRDNDPAPIVARTLRGDGQPISDERVLVPAPPGGMNAMSPALRRLPDGRIGLLFSYRQSVTEASRRFMTSSDEGATWSTPVIVAAGGYVTGCHDRLTVHSSGRLLAPCHCTDNWNEHYLYVRVARSDDLGRTWTLSDSITLPRVQWPSGSGGPMIESGCVEPGIAERADASLLMTIRTAMGTQFKSESFDGGATWTPARSMEVTSPMAPAHLSRFPGTPHLLLLWTPDYNPHVALGGERHTIIACVSTDGGRSWPVNRRKVLIHDPARSIDYPVVFYRQHEAWVALRVSTGVATTKSAFAHRSGILEGLTSTCLMKVPLRWFSA